jgi:hypothetical protein
MRNNARLKQLGLVDEGGEKTSKMLISHLYHVAETLNMDAVLIDVSIAFFITLRGLPRKWQPKDLHLLPCVRYQ